MFALLFLLPVAFAAPCGPGLEGVDWAAALGKIERLSTETLRSVAERLVHSHASTELDDQAFAKNLFFKQFSRRLTPTVRISYDLLRNMPLDLTDAEIGLLAALVPEVRRRPPPALNERLFTPRLDDFVANAREVLARDEYRLALVELIKRGVEPAKLIQNVRGQNALMGPTAMSPNFSRADLKLSLRRILKKDGELTFLVTISQMVEAVIFEIIAHGRATSAHFGEDPFSLRGNELHTMVRAPALRWACASYFREKVSLTSSPHVLRALINTFGNIEPLPPTTEALRRQIAAEARIFAAEL